MIGMIERGSKIAVKGTFWQVDDVQIRSGKIVIQVSHPKTRRDALKFPWTDRKPSRCEEGSGKCSRPWNTMKKRKQKKL
jgi:hypothetical protein